MPNVVTIPEVGDVNFPDSMSQEEISKAAAALYENRRAPRSMQVAQPIPDRPLQIEPSFFRSPQSSEELAARNEQERRVFAQSVGDPQALTAGPQQSLPAQIKESYLNSLPKDKASFFDAMKRNPELQQMADDADSGLAYKYASKSLKYLGGVLEGATQDLAEIWDNRKRFFKLGQPLGTQIGTEDSPFVAGQNTLHAALGEPTPTAQKIQNVQGVPHVLAEISGTVARMLPEVYASGGLGKALQAGGMSETAAHATAAGVVFGHDEEGNFDPKQAALMAAAGPIGKLGSAAVVKALQAAGVPLMSDTAMKAAQAAGSFAAVQAYFDLMAMPEYLKADADKRAELWAHNFGVNALLHVPAAVGLASGAVNEKMFERELASRDTQQAQEAARRATLPEPLLRGGLRGRRTQSHFDTKVAREQKKFLLDATEQAIAEAPDVPAAEVEKQWQASEPNAAQQEARKWAHDNPQPREPQRYDPEFKTDNGVDEAKLGAAQNQWAREVMAHRQRAETDLAHLLERYAPQRDIADAVSRIESGTERAFHEARPHVTIEVPGDGTFSVVNTKDALKDFKERAAKFPTSKPRVATASNARTTASNPAPVGSATPENIAKAASKAVSTDPSRNVLHHLWSDGKETVATNGRWLLRVFKGLGGTAAKPKLFTVEGKPSDEKANYPDWRQAIPAEDSTHEVFKGLDTAQLWTVLKQAEQVVTEKSNAVKVWRNKDGTIGVSANAPDVGEYAHNVKDGAKVVGAWSPYYLMDALAAARLTGSEKVSLHWVDEKSPLLIRGKTMEAVIMPMQLHGPGGHGFTSDTLNKYDLIPEAQREAAMRAELAKLEAMGGDRNASEIAYLREQLGDKAPPHPYVKPVTEDTVFFGNLDAGESDGTRAIQGNFKTKSEATALANKSGGTVEGYLNGKFKRGWVVNASKEKPIRQSAAPKPVTPEVTSEERYDQQQLLEVQAQAKSLDAQRQQVRRLLDTLDEKYNGDGLVTDREVELRDTLPKKLAAIEEQLLQKRREAAQLSTLELPTRTPTLLEYAKSRLPKETADKITDETQVESFRAQYEKEFPSEVGKQSTNEQASYREKAAALAEKLEGIKSGRKPGDLQVFGVIPAVWDKAIEIAQGIIRASGSVADAVKAALEHIRAHNDEPFDEAAVRGFLDEHITPGKSAEESRAGEIVADADEAAPEHKGFQVNIAGRTYEIADKVRFSPEEIAAADKAAQATFQDLGLPGAPDTTADRRAGTVNNNSVWRIEPDGRNHDAAVKGLREHIIEQIQKQHLPGGDIPYTTSLINAVNMNFDHGLLRQISSKPVLESLLDVTVGESSKLGSMLRMHRGISEDVRAVAQNAELHLQWQYAEALDPDGVAKGSLKRIVEGIRKYLTEAEITDLARKMVKPEEAARVIAALRKAIAGDWESLSDIMKSAHEALMDAGMSEAQARKIVSAVETILGQTIRDGANQAIAEMKAALTPGEKRSVAGRAVSEIQKMLLNDLFGYGDLLARLAKSERWTVPTAKEFEQMRAWAKREEAMRTPTAALIAKLGGDAAAAGRFQEAATIDARKELLRKMNTQWSQWTKPLITNWRDLGDPEKVKNTNSAFNEWVAANLLLKLGFGTRQMIDVGSQTLFHTPTRALSYALESWGRDRAENRDSNLQHSIAEAMSDAYRSRAKVLLPALNAFKQTLQGKGEQRQVEQLITSIGIFERALLNASKMRSEGKRGAANLLEIITVSARMGRQFAAAMDVLHGIPAEAQEIAHQVRNALNERGLGKVATDMQFDSIMNLLVTHRAEAMSMAQDILAASGDDASKGAVERAAWHILREKVYSATEQAGMPADDWKKNNAEFRDLIGWNISETGYKGAGPGGPGGLVSLAGKKTKEMLLNVPVAGGPLSVPFTFANAMGISLNRKLAWSPLGFFPGLFKGSPYFEGETNIRQRKIEASLGTGLSAVVFTLIVGGVWKALPAFWPKDDKERDRWAKNGWSPGMVIIPWGNGQEVHLSTRVGPLAMFAPAIAAAAAYTQKQDERAKKQAALNERAKQLGVPAEKLPDMGWSDWMGVMGDAAYSAVTGGRTASGALSAYSDFGQFNIKKAGASVVTAITPGLPAVNEFGRMAGANINPKLASFWDLLVPLPTSSAQRVNLLGDPMRDENDYRRIFQILSGGNLPIPTSASTSGTDTQAYAALFGSDYRPPSINPGLGRTINGRVRPFTPEELNQYTVARGAEFKKELGTLGANPSTAEVKAAFQRANARALAGVGVTVRAARPAARISEPTRSKSRFRLGMSTRKSGLRSGGLRSLKGSSLRGGLRPRRKRLTMV